MSEYGGILAAVQETADIQQASGCTWAEAVQTQQHRASERMQVLEPARECNVIPFPTRS